MLLLMEQQKVDCVAVPKASQPGIAKLLFWSSI